MGVVLGSASGQGLPLGRNLSQDVLNTVIVSP